MSQGAMRSGTLSRDAVSERVLRKAPQKRSRLRVPARSLALYLALVTPTVCIAAVKTGQATEHEPVVRELMRLLESRPDLRRALTEGIQRARLAGLNSPEDFFEFCDELATWIPVERELSPRGLRFYYVIDEAPDDALNQDPEFNEWLGDFARTVGSFLDTPASAANIATFTANPDYHVDDYIRGPSGWLTFNQFFAREVRPGKRPVAAPCDDRVIVSAADSVFLGQWPIAKDSTVTVKGVRWSIAELLAGSPYAKAFENGTYTHSFLNVNDYHRYHLPVGGVVKEVRKIPGRFSLDVVRNEAGNLEVRTGDTFQFNQERGLVVIDSPDVGLVAILPVGMAVISSVNLTLKVGDVLRKGEEFGYFLFGGSDIVMLFQNRRVVLDAQVGTKYLQGQRIGFAR